MGERSGLTDECTTGESRDVASLDLPGVQEELVLAVAATGTPVVLVLVAGRPIGSEAVHRAAGAVLMAWLPGEHGAAGGGRGARRRAQPGRQAAGHLPAQLRPDPDVLRPQGVRRPVALEGRVRRPVQRADVPVRPRPELLAGSTWSLDTSARWTVDVDDVVDVVAKVRNAGAVRCRRGRPAVQPGPDRLDHPAGARAAGVRPRRSRAGWHGACSVPPARRLARVHRAPTCRMPSSRARSSCSSGPPRRSCSLPVASSSTATVPSPPRASPPLLSP